MKEYSVNSPFNLVDESDNNTVLAKSLDVVHEKEQLVVVNAEFFANLLVQRNASFDDIKNRLAYDVQTSNDYEGIDAAFHRFRQSRLATEWHDTYINAGRWGDTDEDEEITDQINTLTAEDYGNEDDYGHDNH
jgi:hypothetical protein